MEISLDYGYLWIKDECCKKYRERYRGFHAKPYVPFFSVGYCHGYLGYLGYLGARDIVIRPPSRKPRTPHHLPTIGLELHHQSPIPGKNPY